MLKNSANLDLLRAMAVCYVLADHSLKFFGVVTVYGVDIQWLGKLGVMFFFVHTCMVLMMSLERTKKNLALPGLTTNFYIRRIFRIYPLSIFAIVFVLFFAIPSAQIEGPFNISGFSPSIHEFLCNILLIQNFKAFHARSIIAVLWSLPFEVQMYALLPFIFMFLARKGRLASLFVMWVLGWVVEYLLQPHAFFLAHFTPGVIAYVMLKRTPRQRIPSWVWPIFLASMTIVFLAMHPGFLTGAVACLIVGVTLPNVRDLTLKPLNIATHNIAKYSYGIYLAHMFCLWFAFIHFHGLPRTMQAAIFLLCIVGVPFLLYLCIEEPMIRAGSALCDRVFLGGAHKKKESTQEKKAEQLEETASGL